LGGGQPLSGERLATTCSLFTLKFPYRSVSHSITLNIVDVNLDLSERAVTAHRHDSRHGAACVRQRLARGFAQTMSTEASRPSGRIENRFKTGSDAPISKLARERSGRRERLLIVVHQDVKALFFGVASSACCKPAG
jgi:hypothetical protein